MSERNTYLIDEAFIRQVAALVIERLKQMSGSARPTPTVCRERIINEERIMNHPAGTTLCIRADALVTPLAKDTAKDRGVELQRKQLL